ncbi:hypothetical protein HZH68_008651 [Vespula germanica]|uniref:Uncharacterized protein n=1 Tax=Vespula germanica TaxID=30212 RepID=A0A834N780_VESGE|nr:hypothetical protein HZH68_008651 [Vespula germanica]
MTKDPCNTNNANKFIDSIGKRINRNRPMQQRLSLQQNYTSLQAIPIFKARRNDDEDEDEEDEDNEDEEDEDEDEDIVKDRQRNVCTHVEAAWLPQPG